VRVESGMLASHALTRGCLGWRALVWSEVPETQIAHPNAMAATRPPSIRGKPLSPSGFPSGAEKARKANGMVMFPRALDLSHGGLS
jgi:hypothetical protein